MAALGAVELVYDPRGAARELLRRRDPELIISGPAGTGKSFGVLWKIHLALQKYPGARALMLRKTRQSLTESGMTTYEQKVLHPLENIKLNGQKQEYPYKNGSIFAVGGLDRPSKILSSEWDIIYIQECNEPTEDAWEMCGMRLRNGVMPYQQLIGDTNPDSPLHWIRGRVAAHRTAELISHHEDNPRLYDNAGLLTEEGAAYLARLDLLTGVRLARFRYGRWVSAEGMIYEDTFNRQLNIRPRAEYCSKDSLMGDCGIDPRWPRYMAVDFGFTHAFVCRWYAMDPDGRAIMYREIYKTHMLVTDHAAVIKRYSKWGEAGGDPLPRRIYTDHDAEDRATLEASLGLRTWAANKNVSAGIEAVAKRLRPAGDGKPRLVYLEDSTVEIDPWLIESKKPTRGVDEIESYIWNDKRTQDQPVKEDDHACDTDRMFIASLDLTPQKVTLSSFKIY